MADTIRTDVYHDVLNTNRRVTIGRFLKNLHKFAVAPAAIVSLKGFTGGKKLYEIFLLERFKDHQPIRRNLEDEKVIMEELQLGKIEDMNEVKQQSKTASGKLVEGSESMKKKKMPQDIKEMEIQDPNRKRIFIRSRL
ncbi:hypothetical protein REPUB_Repub05bG0052700 [Reevesia pubescens]